MRNLVVTSAALLFLAGCQVDGETGERAGAGALIGAGLVSLESGFAVTLGANLGTTITALMASLAGNGAIRE